MSAPVFPSPRIALLGAFDRFNYGDLLFPIIAANEIGSHSPNAETCVHALVTSDLSRFGALRTRALRELYGPGALRAGDVVLFAGGGTIGVDWTFMLSNLLGPAANTCLGWAARIVGYRRADALSRRYFGARAPYPWVAGPEDFPVPVKVAYNAVGGSELARLPADVQAGTLDRLSRAAYLSVRDDATHKVFEPVQDRVQVHVAPDSAVLMSEQFPVEQLRRRASPETLTLIDESPYVCFHANRGYIRRHFDGIVKAMEALHEAHGMPVLLLPIGRYVGLDDHIGLAELQQRLRVPARLAPTDATLWDIMLTVAQSRLFIGTSLHGAVTSQSFGVPHLGLSERRSKLDHYLATWDLPEQSTCAALSDLPHRAGIVLGLPEQSRLAKRSELIRLARANFLGIARHCGLQWK